MGLGTCPNSKELEPKLVGSLDLELESELIGSGSSKLGTGT